MGSNGFFEFEYNSYEWFDGRPQHGEKVIPDYYLSCKKVS
jgi:hypothetical protein